MTTLRGKSNMWLMNDDDFDDYDDDERCLSDRLRQDILFSSKQKVIMIVHRKKMFRQHFSNQLRAQNMMAYCNQVVVDFWSGRS